MLIIDGIEIDTVDLNEIEVILEEATLEDDENPFERQAREWSDHCACERLDRKLNPDMQRHYDTSHWNHHGSSRW